MELLLILIIGVILFYLHSIRSYLRKVHEKYYLAFDEESVKQQLEILKIISTTLDKRYKEMDYLYNKEKGKSDEKFNPSKEYRRNFFERRLLELSVEAARSNYLLLLECNNKALQGQSIQDLHEHYKKRFKYHVGELRHGGYFREAKWLEEKAKKEYLSWEKDHTTGEKLQDMRISIPEVDEKVDKLLNIDINRP